MKHHTIVLICFLAFINLDAQVVTKTVKLPLSTAAPAVIAFRAAATYIGGEPIATNSEKKVDFTGVYFDESKNFSVVNDEFAAPSDGIYHFDLRVGWIQFSSPGMITLLLRTNLYEQIAMTSVQTSSTTQIFDSNFGALLKLKAGDKVSVYLSQNSGTQQKYQQVILSGFKVN
jgi:C1q domain